MSNLKNIRKKLGISQQEAADWLGISRSLVNHYERKSRSLPTHALMLLSKTEIMILEFEKQNNLQDTYPDDKKILNDYSAMDLPFQKEVHVQAPVHPRLALNMDKVARLQQQLAVHESRFSALQWQLLLIKHLLDNCTSEKQQLWLQMQYETVCYKLNKSESLNQNPLKFKLMELQLKAGRKG